jgi:hypothetical protein
VSFDSTPLAILFEDYFDDLSVSCIKAFLLCDIADMYILLLYALSLRLLIYLIWSRNYKRRSAGFFNFVYNTKIGSEKVFYLP